MLEINSIDELDRHYWVPTPLALLLSQNTKRVDGAAAIKVPIAPVEV